MKENSQNQLIRRRRLSMQILVCDDNPYMVNRLFDLIQQQISLQGISSTFLLFLIQMIFIIWITLPLI